MGKLLFLALLIGGLVMYFRLRAGGTAGSIRSRSRVIKNDQIEALLTRLADAAGVDRLELRLLDDPSINGVATATGEIYITEGMFARFRSGDITAREIASVAAHELGHVALGHIKRRMAQTVGASVALWGLAAVLGRLIPFIGPYIAPAIIRLFTAQLSQRDEYEADQYATALMVRSGIGAEHQASLLEKLPRLIPEATAGSGLAVKWLESHPPIEKRTAVIRENAARWEADGKVPGIRPADS